jgi:hypothetical protein
MSTSSQRLSAVLLLSAAAALAASVRGEAMQVGATPRNTPIAAAAVVRSALPSEKLLAQYRFRGFELREHTEEGDGVQSAYVHAVRDTDGLILDATADVANNADAARRWTQFARTTTMDIMVKGSPSGRRIAEEVWRPRYPGDGTPRGYFLLVARQGLAVVAVHIFYQDAGPDGASPVVDHFDVVRVERFVAQAIAKLAKVNTTSTRTDGHAPH